MEEKRKAKMTKIRNPTKKYKISKHKFLEMYHFCMQYNEWKNELEYKKDTRKSLPISDLPMAAGIKTDSTGALAIRRADLENKCKMIEQTAVEADAELYQYILKAVTNEYVSFNYLKTVHEMPCGRTMYYERRRRFYWLLSKKI